MRGRFQWHGPSMYWNCLELTHDSHPDTWHLVILAFESLESPAINHEHPTLSSDHIGSLYTITVIPMMYHDVSIYIIYISYIAVFILYIYIFLCISIIYISIYSYYTREICLCISHISHISRPGLASDFRRTRGSRLERQKTGGAWRGMAGHCRHWPRFIATECHDSWCTRRKNMAKHGKSWKID